MKCAACFTIHLYDPNFTLADATMVVGGASTCDKHAETVIKEQVAKHPMMNLMLDLLTKETKKPQSSAPSNEPPAGQEPPDPQPTHKVRKKYEE